MVTSRQAMLAALLGVVPTTGYAVWSPEMFPYVSVVNVVLITAALYLMTSPSADSASPA
ncbi:MAG: cytochrome-ba3 oxidase subunit [Halobacteriales archaeon]